MFDPDYFVTKSGRVDSNKITTLQQHKEEIFTATTNCESEDLLERFYWFYHGKTDYSKDDFCICESCGKEIRKPFYTFKSGYTFARKDLPDGSKKFCSNKCRGNSESWKSAVSISTKLSGEMEIINAEEEAINYFKSKISAKGSIDGNVIKSVPLSLKCKIDIWVSPNLKTNDIHEKIYWLIVGLQEYPRKCKECGEPITFFKGFGYDVRAKYCSVGCRGKSGETKQLRSESNIKKYGFKNAIQNPNIRQKAENTCLMRYGVANPSQDGEIFDRIIHNQMRWKEFVLPSGRIVKIQGYEDKALAKLLGEYSEDDIVIGRKNIPKFRYISADGKQHIYFPDFFIPKDNTIVEVKSEWTMKIQKNNDLKFQAVRDDGYELRLMIF